MSDTGAIDGLLGRVTREVRWRRAERGAWRGAFWGIAAGALILALKGTLGPAAVPLALCCALGGLAGGALVAATRKLARIEAARLADRALALEDRVATALEHIEAPGARDARAPVVEALLADTSSRVARLQPRWLLQRMTPREAWLLPLPLAAAMLLAIAPALTGPNAFLPEWLSGAAQERRAQQQLPASLEQRAANAQEFLRRKPLEAREAAAAAQRRNPPSAADAEAQFKDKALGRTKVDFSSFLKKGDERLRMLENADKLPDLQSDFASSKYKSMLKKSQELTAGGRAQNISAKKLAELLREMERLGRKEGNFSDEAMEGLEALERGQTGDALEAMEHALDKLRQMEDQQRSARDLKGGRDQGEDGRAAINRSMDQALADQNSDRQGVGAGSGKGPDGKAKPSPRLRSTPYTSGVQGDRRGRQPNFEIQMQGNSSSAAAQAQYLGVIGQYRRMMEDAITREQVPRDYHEQIRDYFKSLNER